MDEINTISAYWHAIGKDCPGKTWFYASLDHRAVYRALRIDPSDDGALYAIHPFRLHRTEEGQWIIIAAHPAPRLFTPIDEDWLAIDTVIAWDPVADRASVLGDNTPQLVGSLTDEANVIYAGPRDFFQAWAQRRAAYFAQRVTAETNAWHAVPPEADAVPGALMVGDRQRIRWNPAALPQNLSVVGAPAAEINKAILRAARLPRISEKAA